MISSKFVVHGFTQWNYLVTEGQSVYIEFGKNIKGETNYSSLGLSLFGNIGSHSYTSGMSLPFLECLITNSQIGMNL